MRKQIGNNWIGKETEWTLNGMEKSANFKVIMIQNDNSHSILCAYYCIICMQSAKCTDSIIISILTLDPVMNEWLVLYTNTFAYFVRVFEHELVLVLNNLNEIRMYPSSSFFLSLSHFFRTTSHCLILSRIYWITFWSFYLRWYRWTGYEYTVSVIVLVVFGIYKVYLFTTITFWRFVFWFSLNAWIMDKYVLLILSFVFVKLLDFDTFFHFLVCWM